jgi:hypothetical protein
MNKKLDHVKLEHTHKWLYTHTADRCAGQQCTIHNRSDHHMRKYPQHWREDRTIMERICEHGVGHPDPDEYRINVLSATSAHYCDGCCASVEWDKEQHNPLAVFMDCPQCGSDLKPEHAHYKCGGCGWRDSCCD